MTSVTTTGARSLLLLLALALAIPQSMAARPTTRAYASLKRVQGLSSSRKELLRNLTSYAAVIGGIIASIILYNAFAPPLQPPAPTSQARCPVCLEESEKIHPVRRKTLRCNHWTCQECFNGLMQTRTNEGEEHVVNIEGEMVRTKDVATKYRLIDRGCPLCRQSVV